MKIILGLTGPNAAGKGEVCKYLGKKGFYVTSLSDILRKIAKRKKISPTRINLVNLGNKLRKKYGSNILAKWTIEDIIKNSNNFDKVVVDSFRNPEEIKEFKKKFNNKFFLLYITAPKKLRFKFMKLRNREGDPKTYKEFLEIERKEKSNKSIQQQIHKCKELKDFYIKNNSTLKNLYKKINKVLEKINLKIYDRKN
ncbi:MAG: AAA family ATPase [Endomicrobiia bacterium]